MTSALEHSIQLGGLDGANPLGFLAALGVLRGLSSVWQEANITLQWEDNGAWRPVIARDDRALDRELVLVGLTEFLERQPGHHALSVDDDLKLPVETFRGVVHAALDRAKDGATRDELDFLAAFGSEAYVPEGMIEDSELRTMSGAGHQHFLKSMRQLAELTTISDVARSLFETWRRAEAPPTLRWDPEDDRRYALRWKEPSTDPIRTERGANRLAFEALPLLPTLPHFGRARTVGFSGRGSKATFWTWPIWETRLGADTVRSLLAQPVLGTSRAQLERMGVVEIFQSQRLTIGKYRNFSPARSV